MGSSCTKTPEDTHRVPSGPTCGRHVVPPTAVSPRPACNKHTYRRRSKSGFESDVLSQRPAAVSALVRVSSNLTGFQCKYDLSDSVKLGSGAGGRVITVRRRGTDDKYALKIIKVEGNDRAKLHQEIEMHKKLDHPNICRIVESFEDAQRIYIVMDLCTGGSVVERMQDYPRGLDETSAATLLEKMCSAVLYCHQHGVVHRDIKLDNIMYENPTTNAEPKLIDFGFAGAVEPGQEVMYERLGTPSYMAPELWSNRQPTYDSSVDMWALGAVAYMLLSGIKPFDHPDKKEKGRMVREDPLDFPSRRWGHISTQAQAFCRALMQKRPRDRICASQAILHPWICQRSRRHSEPEQAAAALRSNSSIVRSLEAYAESEKLKQIAFDIMAFSTPPQRLGDLRRVFQSIDTDDSGTIDLREFKDAMKPVGRQTSAHIERIFDKIDAAKSGEIDYTKFLAATLSSHGSGELRKSVGTAFDMLDTSGDGVITRADLETALTGQLSLSQLSQSDLDSMMECADSDAGVSSSAFEDAVLGPRAAIHGESKHGGELAGMWAVTGKGEAEGKGEGGGRSSWQSAVTRHASPLVEGSVPGLATRYPAASHLLARV